MKALVLGAGKVGLGIAQHLVDQGADVIIVDKSPQTVSYVKHYTTIPVALCDAFDLKALKTFLPDAPSHIVAAMPNDEQNILACKIVGNEFSASTKIARIRSSIFTRDEVSKLYLKNTFDIDTIIQPEIEVAKTIASIVPIKNASDVAYLSDIVIVSLKCLPGTEILNTKMTQFESITDFLFSVLTISRGDQTFFPSANDVLLPNDEVYLAMSHECLPDVLRLFGYSQEYKQNILIVGGGNIGETLARTLLEQYPNISVTLIEKSQERANDLAQKYPRLMVMFGEAQNSKFLQDAAREIDTAVIATNDDKVNILTTLFLKMYNVSRIFALSNNKDYEQLLVPVCGGSIINPNTVVVDNIVKQSRDINGLETITLINQFACVVEAKVTEACNYLGGGLNLLTAKNQMRPIFIVHDGSISVPKKDYKITLGDTIILIVVKEQFSKIEKFFGESFSKIKIFGNNK